MKKEDEERKKHGGMKKEATTGNTLAQCQDLIHLIS
jgi:hypothetical protein